MRIKNKLKELFPRKGSEAEAAGVDASDADLNRRDKIPRVLVELAELDDTPTPVEWLGDEVEIEHGEAPLTGWNAVVQYESDPFWQRNSIYS
jgi:hypothetical protein